MKISHIDIYKFSIPMHPFTIATGTMHFAQNIFIRIYTTEGLYGVGECSAFPVITGESQSTCFAMAQDFALLWKNKDPLNIPGRLAELHAFTAFNNTIKSAFDMALYDINAKVARKPLYAFLGGEKKALESDITIGIDTPEAMAKRAVEFKNNGAQILKIKLGRSPEEDIERVRRIRNAIGNSLHLRIDANQGWTFDEAVHILTTISPFDIDLCEQPMRSHQDHLLPKLNTLSPIPIMADESVFDHYDAERIIKSNGCSFVNIKLAKSGGIHEALKIDEVCRFHSIPCMMGGMLESRIALTASAHFASALPNIKFYDMDTCMMGHKLDPVTGGITYNKFTLELPDGLGIGADAAESFLQTCEHIVV